ncbi:MAG: hypothetical protein HQL80_07935 [Magnetococcales bacterium]|nr:hypothetical protein [Magnetococcales bacterium]MBF0584148.1 hypothetical protein [Magnetococcales bacterium]
MQQKIIALVSAAIEEINAMRAAEQRISTAPETLLAGEGGVLDSLWIANLIVTIELQVEAQFNRRLDLIEWVLEKSTERLSIGDLIQLICERVE